jgi:hypothetical protein
MLLSRLSQAITFVRRKDARQLDKRDTANRKENLAGDADSDCSNLTTLAERISQTRAFK